MDTNQNNDQNNQSVVPPVPAQQMVQGVPPAASQQTPQQQPVQAPSVTPHGKEASPLPTAIPGEVADYVEPASHETTPALESQVEDAGVEVSPSEQDLNLTDEHTKAGIEPAKESVPVSLHPQGTVSSPMTLPQAEEAAGGKANNSKTWLGKLVVFVFGQQPYMKNRE